MKLTKSQLAAENAELRAQNAELAELVRCLKNPSPEVITQRDPAPAVIYEYRSPRAAAMAAAKARAMATGVCVKA